MLLMLVMLMCISPQKNTRVCAHVVCTYIHNIHTLQDETHAWLSIPIPRHKSLDTRCCNLNRPTTTFTQHAHSQYLLLTVSQKTCRNCARSDPVVQNAPLQYICSRVPCRHPPHGMVQGGGLTPRQGQGKSCHLR